MSEIQLEFKNDFPKNQEKVMRDLLSPLLRLVKRDLSRLQIRIDDELGPGACIKVKRRYHIASIWIGSSFFLMETWEQTEVLTHELIHVLVDIFYRDVIQVVEAYWEEDSTTKHLLDVRFEDSMEKLTDALSLAFGEILDEVNLLNSGWDA